MVKGSAGSRLIWNKIILTAIAVAMAIAALMIAV
jgi:hypothetical protein